VSGVDEESALTATPGECQGVEGVAAQQADVGQTEMLRITATDPQWVEWHGPLLPLVYEFQRNVELRCWKRCPASRDVQRSMGQKSEGLQQIDRNA